jgi:hypothetical protein
MPGGGYRLLRRRYGKSNITLPKNPDAAIAHSVLKAIAFPETLYKGDVEMFPAH